MLFENKKRYRSWNEHLKEKFNTKIFKVPIDGGFTCPNRDGKKAFGGCTFCSKSGSGDTLVAPKKTIRKQFQEEVNFLHHKWPKARQYIVYFQNFTNTYASVPVLRERYEQVINLANVVGLSIGTRPDCLPNCVLDYLAEINQRTFLWVELGLQTTFARTSTLINRNHNYETYLTAVESLRKRKINVCTHLINGLPGETSDEMLENVRRVCLASDIQGLKLHLLHLMKNTKMVRDYHAGRLKLMKKNDYVNLIVKQLEIVPKDIVIHRLTGDAPFDSIIGPMWSLKKWEILNAIDDELEKQNSWQGKFAVR